MKKLQYGFTLMEVLIVIAIILLFSGALLMNLRGQVVHGQDSKRKTDLYMLRKALEDYYTDKNTFPDASFVTGCGSTMPPWITKVPCDPATKQPYGYFRSADGGYRICAQLVDKTDRSIASIGCDGPLGCGVGGGYNYCLTSGTAASAVGTTDQIGSIDSEDMSGVNTPTPIGGFDTPTPVLNPEYNVVCTNGGDCNTYENPSSPQHRCPISWETECPPGACAILANRCAD